MHFLTNNINRPVWNQTEYWELLGNCPFSCAFFCFLFDWWSEELFYAWLPSVFKCLWLSRKPCNFTGFHTGFACRDRLCGLWNMQSQRVVCVRVVLRCSSSFNLGPGVPTSGQTWALMLLSSSLIQGNSSLDGVCVWVKPWWYSTYHNRGLRFAVPGWRSASGEQCSAANDDIWHYYYGNK